MRVTLIGLGRDLGWPVARTIHATSLPETEAAARELLAEHPDCDQVDVMVGDDVHLSVTRGGSAS